MKKRFVQMLLFHMTKIMCIQLSTDEYLTHHWPICAETMNDVIDSATMSPRNSTYFTLDRFSNENSALALNGAWAQIPSGIYFDSLEFTISTWIYPQNVESNAKIIDFGNGSSADRISFGFASGATLLRPRIQIYNKSSSSIISVQSSQNLTLNQWNFVTVTLNRTSVCIYLNGTYINKGGTNNNYILPTIWRTDCFIGKDNTGSGYSWSILDDLRFYNKSLTQSEIFDLMNNKTSMTDKYLTHYWPIKNMSTNDETASSNMQVNFSLFTLDRFGNENSSLALNGGWTQVPSGIYFDSTEFTISVWVYPQQVGSWSRIIDFGNGNGKASNNIVFALSSSYSLQPAFQIFNESQSPSLILAVSSQTLTLNTWQFVAVTFNGRNSRIYVNGILTADVYLSFNRSTFQYNNCFIGKPFSGGYSFSYLDDLRFYNKSLNETEIFDLINEDETSKYLKRSFSVI